MSTKIAPVDGLVDHDAFIVSCRLLKLEPTIRQKKKWKQKTGAAFTHWIKQTKEFRRQALKEHAS